MFEDPLLVFDRTKTQTHSLRGLLAGRSSFLVCGGPSANTLDLTQMNQRGIFSMAVNNMGGKHWPNAFVCADPPSKFHHGIWLDPTVMKFVPFPKLSGSRARLRRKEGDKFYRLRHPDGTDLLVPHCPNIWGFERRSWLVPDDSFFNNTQAAWGNHSSGVLKTGLEKTVCTMLLAIRLLSYLGSRRIYLVGVDWRMDPSTSLQGNYAFGEDRQPEAVQSNNQQYLVAGSWLETMQKNGTFARHGLEIFNCYDRSSLRAFPHVPYEVAIQDVLSGFPTQPFDLTGWYEKREEND